MKSQFLYVSLAFYWVSLDQHITVWGLISGYLVGVALVSLSRYLLGEHALGGHLPSVRQIWNIAAYIVRLFWEIAVANWVVLKTVLQPKMSIAPGIVAVPTRTQGAVEETILANSITLTPGTWTMEVAEDESVFYVHALDASDPEAVKASIKSQLEDHILRATRC
jgi:multicomponent Na+:H+ antiporter subunit E